MNDYYFPCLCVEHSRGRNGTGKPLCRGRKANGGACHAEAWNQKGFCRDHLSQWVPQTKVRIAGEEFEVHDAKLSFDSPSWMFSPDMYQGKKIRLFGSDFILNGVEISRPSSAGGSTVTLSLVECINDKQHDKKEEKDMMEQLRTLNLDRVDLDDAIGLLTFAKQAKATYVEMGLEAPAWFADKVAGLEAYIKQRRVENLTKAAKEIEAELGKLKTAEEKRSDLRARLEQIQAALGK